MGIVGTLLVIGGVIVIARLLRSMFAWIDWVSYLVILVIGIIQWINNGFWSGLLAFFIGAVIITILFGLGDSTEVYVNGRKGEIECPKCQYGKLDIISNDNGIVTAKCKRCGEVSYFGPKS